MGNNKRVIILVMVALVLAITAIALNVADSDIPTKGQASQGFPTGAVIGIEIQQAPIEDKLMKENIQQ